MVVVTRPARPAGRGLAVLEPPVALLARELGLPVLQPQRVRDPGFLAELRALELDLGIVVAYGALLPRELLELPRCGFWNVHASLLPRWRGAAPVAAAIAAGDAFSGVSIQRMVEALDAGPVLACRAEAIREDDTAGVLEARLAELGAQLLVEVLEQYERQPFAGTPQDESQVTWAPRLEGPWTIDWSLPAGALLRMVRSRLPRPGVRVEVKGELLAVTRLRLKPSSLEGEQEAGIWVASDDVGACAVVAGDGQAVWLERLKRPGRREHPAVEVLRGLRLLPGRRLRPVPVGVGTP
jgi:methionyl-tRNA formyltransferase